MLTIKKTSGNALKKMREKRKRKIGKEETLVTLNFLAVSQANREREREVNQLNGWLTLSTSSTHTHTDI